MEKDYSFVLNAIAQAIFDKKGSNILALDIRQCSSLADYVVIAEGNVDRHVIAIAQAVEQTLSNLGMTPSFREGVKTGDWIVLDYIQVMVHIFMPGMREKYQLERLWQTAEIVDVSIDVSHERSVNAG